MDALFDLPAAPKAAPRRRPSPAAPSPRRTLPGCRACHGPLTDWCRAVDALPETGVSGSADRIIALIHHERDRRSA